MSTISTRPPGRSARATSVQRAGRFRRVVEHERQHGGVQFARPDRQRFELTLPELDVRPIGEAPPGCVEHVGRAVDRDDALDVRGDRIRELSSSATEVADDERWIDQTEHAP